VIARPLETLNPYFLAVLLNSWWGIATVSGLLVGVAQQHFNVTVAKELRIRVPDRNEQDKIVSIICAYNDLIENNLRRIKILEEMAQALYREWFVKFRFPGHENVRMVDSPLRKIPEGWEVIKVRDLLKKIERKPRIKKRDYKSFGDIPIVDQGRDFVGGYTSDSDAMHDAPLPIIIFGDHTRILKYVDFPFASGADGTQLLRSNDKRMPMLLFFYVLFN